MPNYLNNPNVPRGIRNNNPGNLIRTKDNWEGKIPFSQSKDTRFEQFKEMRYGIRAMMKDIIGDIKEGSDTVSKLIHEYAPTFENNTTGYIATVTKMIGIGLTSKIDLSEETIIGLCKAIVFVENGSSFASYVTDQDYKDAVAILGIPLKKKVVKVCPTCGQSVC